MINQALHISFLRDAHVYGFYEDSVGQCSTRYPFLKHNARFDFYTMILYDQSGGSVTIDKNVFPAIKGRIFLVPPFTDFSVNPTGKDNGLFLFFCKDFYAADFNAIHLIYLYSFFNKLRKSNVLHYIDLPSEITDIYALVALIDSEHKKKMKSSGTIFRSYLNIIIQRLILIVCKGVPADSSLQVLDKLSALIEGHFRDQRSIAFYASQTNLSEKKLNNLCMSLFGSGLKQLILERTMMEARKMLEQTNLTVAEIAFNLHFSDNSNFNKTFKAYTHITPRRYREIHKRLA